MEAREEYAGFWVRVGATFIDVAIIMVVVTPITLKIYGAEYWTNTRLIIGGWDFLVNWVLPAIAIVLFWHYKSATPGKMMLRLYIADADSGGKPSTRQLVIRYLGYFVSTLPLCLGLVWVGID
ncbi:MAG: RDD family protein, partial [Xanthomonadales bacterium]|nr:RDD family protein [Xanthomonadales bacterium]